MKEVAILFDGAGKTLYEHCPSDATEVSIPDSDTLWQAIWERREHLAGIVHLHPGTGTPRPSETDITTFAAIERGLGRRLFWFIASADEVTLYVMGSEPEEDRDAFIEAAFSAYPDVERLRNLGEVLGATAEAINQCWLMRGMGE